MVIGINTRPVVKSAKSLGMRTIALDGFGDLDLRESADVVYCPKVSGEGLDEGTSGRELLSRSIEFLDEEGVDSVLLSSGTEHYPELIERIREKAEVLGNDVQTLRICSDKEKLFSVAQKVGLSTPNTLRVGKVDEALDFADGSGYPVVLKSSLGGGGLGVAVVGSPDELRASFEEILSLGDRESLYVQERLEGIDASVSLISDGEEARCLTVNEQIIGEGRLKVPRPFGYCGNVVPLKDGKVATELAELSEGLCSELGLVGSNGMDFVVSDRPYLVEVNPRFQGTIDCVEEVLGINLVEEHIDACRGEIGSYGRPKGCCAKLILYAPYDLVAPDLEDLPIVDVPMPGSIIKESSPMCSVVSSGEVRKEVVERAYSLASDIYKVLSQTTARLKRAR